MPDQRNVEPSAAPVLVCFACGKVKGGRSGRPLPAPGMTDLMVTPESIDAYLAENPPTPDRCIDPLGDAISVLGQIDLAALSAHPDTEDAGNRVAVALGYLREAVKIEPQAQSEPRPKEPLAAIAELLRPEDEA